MALWQYCFDSSLSLLLFSSHPPKQSFITCSLFGASGAVVIVGLQWHGPPAHDCVVFQQSEQLTRNPHIATGFPFSSPTEKGLRLCPLAELDFMSNPTLPLISYVGRLARIL